VRLKELHFWFVGQSVIKSRVHKGSEHLLEEIIFNAQLMLIPFNDDSPPATLIVQLESFRKKGFWVKITAARVHRLNKAAAFYQWLIKTATKEQSFSIFHEMYFDLKQDIFAFEILSK